MKPVLDDQGQKSRCPARLVWVKIIAGRACIVELGRPLR